MSILALQDGNIEIKKNKIIFTEGQTAKSINILLQGEVEVYTSPIEKSNGIIEEELIKNSFRIYAVDQNMFIGSSNIFSSKNYSYSYKASKDSMLYIFCARNYEEINALLLSHKEYGAYIMTSICNSINLSYNSLERINALISELKSFNSKLVLNFWYLKDKHGFSCNPTSELFTDGLNRLNAMENKYEVFDGKLDTILFDSNYPINEIDDNLCLSVLSLDSLEYYKHFTNIPMDIRKNFYAADNVITITQCTDASNFLTKVQELLRYSLKDMIEQLSSLYSNSSECIFSEYLNCAYELKLKNSETCEIFQALDYIMIKIQELTNSLMDNFKYSWISDIFEVINTVDNVKVGNKPKSENENLFITSNETVQQVRQLNIPEELYFSASKIIDYSGISNEKAQLFSANVEAFINLQDKSSTDDTAINIKKTVTTLFFEIYEAVLKKVIQEKNQSRLLHMFLTFGYMDERLLEPEQINELYNLVDSFTITGGGTIYSMREWLTSVYDLKRDPSMNEFSQDYSDIFRDMKKRHEVTDKDWHSYNLNKDAKLNFEINNMFKVNHRACCGHVGLYYPILHSGMISRNISKAIVTPELIEEAVEKLLEIDYSIFHREISYKNPNRGIEKELIMKSVVPEIILMPIFGTRASMWQEITGRNRGTPGRFIIPILTDEDLFDIIIKIAGNYRWELCRTMMGVYWNDLSQKSLTSEYTDYIQFYKKNRELSEDVKGKISMQILKYRSMMRDIFTSDYEQWIKYESKGIIRLNKVSRSILYKYCPFPKETRERISKHPMFCDLDAQFNIMNAKRVKEIKNHYTKLSNSGISPDEIMEYNLKFYEKM